MTMTHPHDQDETDKGPYATAAHAYRAAGWYPLPLPYGQKKSPPNGWTGRDGGWPSGPDVQAWVEDHAGSNIALRMPPNVLGIDVDDYKDKPGAAVLDALQTQHGQLPPTWTSSSRGGRSGIRFYRVPEGLRWPGILGPGIETIRYDHRYAVAWPSLHPEGGTYRWTQPDSTIALEAIPTVDELPTLPHTWVQALTGGVLSTDQPRADLRRTEIDSWLYGRGLNPLCRVMQNVYDRGLQDLYTSGASRHDAALALTNRIAWLTGEGHAGGSLALAQAKREFEKVTSDRHESGEWDRMVDGAVRLSAAAHPTPQPDPCDDPFAGLIPKGTPSWAPSTSATKQWDISETASPSLGASPTPSNGSPTSSTTPPPNNSPQVRAGEPATRSEDSSLPNADDLTELQIRRNQALAQALENMRAQRAAARHLEAEDEDGTIGDRVRRKLLDDKANHAYKAITEPPTPPFDAGTLTDILARPDEPPMRIDQLIPWSGSALIVAQRKTGKTTLLLNYARSILTGEPFLNEFNVLPLNSDATVAFLNYEVSAAQLARWADEVGVPPDRFYLVNLRGRRNPLGHPEDRATLANDLRARNVQSVVVDPFGRAFTGTSQNDNGEVQAFLTSLEQFSRTEVGAPDLLLAAHAGWGGERSRGASALEDWGDVIITLTRDDEDESRRFMKAIGRDVDIDEDEIIMDPLTRILARTGNGSRKGVKNEQKLAQLSVLVCRAAYQQPGLNLAELQRAVKTMDDYQGGGHNGIISEAARYAESKGRLRIESEGSGRPNHYYDTNPSQPIPTPPRDGSPTPPTPPLGGRGGGGGV